jgi:hypothetical protein
MVSATIAARAGRPRRQLLKEKKIRRILLRFSSYASGAADGGEHPDAGGLVDSANAGVPMSCAPVEFNGCALQSEANASDEPSVISGPGLLTRVDTFSRLR